MKACVVVFPGSNCDRDVQVALSNVIDGPVEMVWHGNSEMAATDLIVLPGGFSYGDYLRSGAMAANRSIQSSSPSPRLSGLVRTSAPTTARRDN